MKAFIAHAETKSITKNIIETHFPDPHCPPNFAQIKILAFGINRADLLQIQGKYPPPSGESEILGLEFCGIIEKLPTQTSLRIGFEIGDRVMGICAAGAYAEKICVPPETLMMTPSFLSHAEAAIIPEALITNTLELVVLGDLKPKQRLLVMAGASGVGSFAIQMAKHLGAEVHAAVGKAEKTAFCEKIGADFVFNYNDIWPETTRQSYDVILDLVGAQYFKSMLHALRPHGKLLCVGLSSGNRAELNLSILLQNKIQIIGSTLRDRSREEKIQLTHLAIQKFGEALSKGKIKPVLDKAFPWSETPLALEYLELQKNLGKIAVIV